MRRSALLTLAFALCALALTLEALLRTTPLIEPWSILGAPAFLGLIASSIWLINDSAGTQRNWAKAALTFAILTPIFIYARGMHFMDELGALPDADLPAGWLTRMKIDVAQGRAALLSALVALIGCVIVAGRSAPVSKA